MCEWIKSNEYSVGLTVLTKAIWKHLNALCSEPTNIIPFDGLLIILVVNLQLSSVGKHLTTTSTQSDASLVTCVESAHSS
jgi:hypothetical protein